MKNPERNNDVPRHLRISEPSPWVRRFAPLAPSGGTILDVASGGGRHVRLFLNLGHPVVAVDKNIEPLEALEGDVEGVGADLEEGGPWPLEGRSFAGIVVTNYLYRPLMEPLLACLEDGGVLIYETFAEGNEKYGRPRNPDHLLRSGELLDVVQGRLQVVAYEHGLIEKGPLPGVIQRICAVKDLNVSPRPVLPD